jgi:hypothetical protein
MLSKDKAEAETKVKQQQVSRWRQALAAAKVLVSHP